ncbi:hypothetical protein WICPIJ_002970 [Wickerhamomyces pijperi]|uniref:Zn(2)-C6 fungal-type domain-containing protein n=1 Tax=Wickerhamomyces pijperi TaxID=599730 RepID=A0A9P8Q8S1_WICPI|nr:hypothetical protein WICPIJ_002970 [Wickerhamomyces pijperi]
MSSLTTIAMGESSALLTNNGMVRKRISKACNYCRQRKIKCDGNPQRCQNCSNHSLECTYSKSGRKKKKTVKAPKKIVKKMSLGDLQKKVEQLDDNLLTLNTKVSQILKILTINNLKSEYAESEYDEYESGEEEGDDEESLASGVEAEAERQQIVISQEPKLIENTLDHKAQPLNQISFPQFQLDSFYNQLSPISTEGSLRALQQPPDGNLASPSDPRYSASIASSAKMPSILSPNSESISSASSISTMNSYFSNSTNDSSLSMDSVKFANTLTNVTRIEDQLTLLSSGIDQIYKLDQPHTSYNALAVDLTDPFGNNLLQ